jgi:hypothetical protein
MGLCQGNWIAITFVHLRQRKTEGLLQEDLILRNPGRKLYPDHLSPSVDIAKVDHLSTVKI